MFTKKYSNYEHPSYNIKAVAQMVGLLPVTLRAWERRYGLPAPERGDQGYRLYSDHDLQTLRWLKTQIDAGMNIGQAARKLNQLRETGLDPAARESSQLDKPLSLQYIQGIVMNSLRKLNDQTGSEALRQAFSLYPTEEVFSSIIEPIMIEIGDAWHRDELPVGMEHFVTNFFQEHLMGLLAAAPRPFRNGVIVAGCLPGEYHQIGILMVVVLMRLRGWNVVYLGPNLSFDRLDEVLIPLRPKIILFSATMPEPAEKVSDLPELINRLTAPFPRIVLGGKGFEKLDRSEPVPYQIIVDTPAITVHKIEELMESR
jgi:MerR family transcriptional regulator, light-induced transcriptional regulator